MDAKMRNEKNEFYFHRYIAIRRIADVKMHFNQ